MAHVIDGSVGIDLTKVLADATGGEHPVGSMVRASDGNFYQYVHANGAIAQYAFVKVDNDYEAATLTTTISGTEPTAVGCAQVALADNEYGWVVRGGGTFTGTTAAAVSADVKIYTSATAGAVDDDSSGHDLIAGVKAPTAIGSATTGTFYAATLMTTNHQD